MRSRSTWRRVNHGLCASFTALFGRTVNEDRRLDTGEVKQVGGRRRERKRKRGKRLLQDLRSVQTGEHSRVVTVPHYWTGRRGRIDRTRKVSPSGQADCKGRVEAGTTANHCLQDEQGRPNSGTPFRFRNWPPQRPVGIFAPTCTWRNVFLSWRNSPD